MKRALAFVCVIPFLTACGKQTGSSDKVSEVTSVTTETAAISSETENAALPVEKVNSIDLIGYINDNGLSGAADIYGISESKYLISYFSDDKVKVRTVDTASGDVSADLVLETLPFCTAEGFWVLSPCESGGTETLFPVGNNLRTDKLLVYDYDLVQRAEVSLESEWRMTSIDVDTAGENVYYTCNKVVGAQEHHCLERLSFDGTSETLLDIPYTFDRDNWLMMMYELKYTPEEIVFLGSVSPRADGSAQSVAAYGTLVPGSAPDYVYRSDTYNNEMEKFCGGAIVHDGGLPFGVAPSGFVEYFKGTERRIIALQNPYETPHIYPSQNGSFFATALEGKNEDGTSIFRITVYDCEGNVLKTEDCSLTASGVIQNACVNEYSRRVFYQIGSGGVLRWNEFTF